ncbi:MAG TPA: choice-of-anchor L domain-containing protein [Nannocystaceae bacterium]|nr:choice-of-anchor L domain-containing protein [Nannocystaceae bacterium]
MMVSSKLSPLGLGLGLTLALSACNGDDGTTGASSTSDSSTSDSSTGNTAGTTSAGTAGTTTMGGTGTGTGTDSTSIGTETQGTTATTDTTASTSTTASTGTTTDTTGVTGTTGGGVCGDGNVDAGEACDDGNDIAGDGCEPDCTLTPDPCGNGQLDDGEDCDGDNLPQTQCTDLDKEKYLTGNLTCTAECTYDVGNCVLKPPCMAPANYDVCDNAAGILTDKNNKKNALKSIGICDLQPANSVVTTAFEFDAMAKNDTWQVAKGFGSYMYDHDNDPNTPQKLLYSPREGDTFLILSSGRIKAPNAQGIVIENPNSQVGNGDNTNSDADALPAPFKTKKGSNDGMGGTPFLKCDNGAGDNDCSDTLQDQWTLGNSNPNDRVYFTFKTKVPEGTYGYTFDFVFCSSEWPTYVNTGFNDLLIAYQVDPTPDAPNVDPYSGNVTFIPDPNDMKKGLPLTITALDPYFDGPGYTFNEPQLAGTGFEQHACSDWFTAKGGVQPGAEVTIGFYLADMSDSILATVAILDNFRWDCIGCVPSEVDDCGVQPM